MSVTTVPPPAAAHGPPAAPPAAPALRALAVERVHRLRRFHLHLMVFAAGLPLLGVVWVVTEYLEEHTWPSRFASAPDVAGTWDPWFFFVAGFWALALVLHALRTYLGPPVGPLGHWVRRPIPEDQLDREVARVRASAWWDGD